MMRISDLVTFLSAISFSEYRRVRGNERGGAGGRSCQPAPGTRCPADPAAWQARMATNHSGNERRAPGILVRQSFGQRQLQGEISTLPRFAAETDAAAVLFNDPMGHGQAQAGAG